MNYTQALHTLKNGNNVKHIDKVNKINSYYSYDFRTGLITSTQYKICIVENMWTMSHYHTYDMTVQEFISHTKKNDIKFMLS